MRTAALALALATTPLAACAPTVNVATEKPIQIALDVRIRLDEDVKDLLRAEQQGVVPRGLDVPLIGSDETGAIASAKRAQRVGERRDGYLGLPRAASDAALAALVAKANDGRKRAYQALASKHGVAPRAVEEVAGERRIAEASAGELVMNPDGEWSPRP